MGPLVVGRPHFLCPVYIGGYPAIVLLLAVKAVPAILPEDALAWFFLIKTVCALGTVLIRFTSAHLFLIEVRGSEQELLTLTILPRHLF